MSEQLIVKRLLREALARPAVEQHRLHCPCHDGWFDLETGRPVAGPPQRALPRILLDVRDSVVYATGVEESAA